MDVCLSKDKQVVVIHDRHLKRMCNIDKDVNQFNYEDLPQIKDQVECQFSDHVFDTTKIKDRKFPLFDDVCRELGI